MTPIRPIALGMISFDDAPSRRPPQPRPKKPFWSYLAAIDEPHVVPSPSSTLSAATGAAIAILNRALVGAE